MILTPSELEEYYALTGSDRYCGGFSFKGERRIQLADAVRRAVDKCVASGNLTPTVADVKYEVYRDEEAGVYGSVIIGVILLAILSGVISFLVQWLLRKLIEKQKRSEH
jgi:hypothetical protein